MILTKENAIYEEGIHKWSFEGSKKLKSINITTDKTPFGDVKFNDVWLVFDKNYDKMEYNDIYVENSIKMEILFMNQLVEDIILIEIELE